MHQDSHTAKHLYEKLLKGPLLENRTVVSNSSSFNVTKTLRRDKILITHHVELVLPGTYYLVRMLEGRIDEQGLVSDLKRDGKLDYITRDAKMQVEEGLSEEKLQEPVADRAAAVAIQGSEQTKPAPRKLVQDEERQEGAVKWRVYKRYLKAS